MEDKRKYGGAMNHGVNVYRMSEIIKDTGYSFICPNCSKRYNESSSLIGQQRPITMAECVDCEKYKANLPKKNLTGHQRSVRDRPKAPKEDLNDFQKAWSKLVSYRSETAL